jgi:hypothetical protein
LSEKEVHIMRWRRGGEEVERYGYPDFSTPPPETMSLKN